MKCRMCGLENPSGVSKCQRCGNSLLPKIPRDEFIPQKNGKKNKGKIKAIGIAVAVLLIFVVLIVTGLTGYIVLNIVNDGLSGESGAVSAVIEQTIVTEDRAENSEYPAIVEDEDSFDLSTIVSEGKITLPGAEFTLGMPEIEDYDTNYDPVSNKNEYYFTFELPGDVIVEIERYSNMNLFSKSQEEEYFSEDYQYEKIAGTEDLYFYVSRPVEDDSSMIVYNATVVDRKNSGNYTIRVYNEGVDGSSDDERKNKLAYKVLNIDILNQASFLDQEAEENKK